MLWLLPPDILSRFYNGTAVIYINVYTERAQVFSATICVLFVLSEVIAFASACGIIYRLRKNVSHFTPKTYRMHVQLTALIIAQVALYAIY